MSVSVSARMTRVRPSATGAVLALAARLKAEGRDIISLGAGEPDFDTPKHIRRAACEAIEAGATRYTPIDGTAELKAAVRRKFQRDNGLDFDPDQILVSSGGKQSLFNLCIALLDAGDEAVVPAPYWVSYPDMVRLAGAEAVIVPTTFEDGFKLTPERLQAALTSKTRLLFINSPSNPTGACYTRQELTALGDTLAGYPDVVVVSDDIYEHIFWGAEPFTSFASACPALGDRCVTVNGVSKAYAMTGWRIGYAGGPSELIRAMQTVQSQSTSNACSVSQVAAQAALDGDQSAVSEMCDAYHQRHDYLISALNDLPGFECRAGDGSFYAFPRVDEAIAALGLVDDTELMKHLLDAANVACVPGAAFGAPGHVRMSFACSTDELETAVGRIRKAL